MDHVRVPSPRFEEDRDNIVVLRDVPWPQYEALLRSRGDRPQPKLAYLDGVLEVMTKGLRHELGKTVIARLLECFAEETDVKLNGAGETTFRNKAKKAGLEPDECYFVGKIRKAPDIAIEVVLTSGGIDKLEIYRRLKIREVWFWIEGRFWTYALANDRYEEIRRSRVLPDFDFDEVARIVLSSDEDEQTAAVKAYRRVLQRRQ